MSFRLDPLPWLMTPPSRMTRHLPSDAPGRRKIYALREASLRALGEALHI